MRYIKEKSIARIEINKSIFYALLYPVSDKDDIEQALLESKKDYPNANHYCYASIYGKHGEYALSFDDEEPHRTAGIPILEVLKHHDLVDVLCVVVRFFGGIKLGSGGLVRAYTKAVSEVLKDTKFYIKMEVPSKKIVFSYHLIGVVDQYVSKIGKVNEKTFDDVVTYAITILDHTHEDLHQIAHLMDQIVTLENQIIYQSIDD